MATGPALMHSEAFGWPGRVKSGKWQRRRGGMISPSYGFRKMLHRPFKKDLTFLIWHLLSSIWAFAGSLFSKATREWTSHTACQL